VNLRREGHPLRIGHRGALALAPENTLPSLAAAIAHGVDVVEMDVLLVERTRSLMLAHSLGDVNPGSPTLAEALAFFVETAKDETGVILDLKSVGVEEEVLEALRRYDLLERSVVASFHASSVRAVKELEPQLTTGLSYPFDRVGIAHRQAFQPVIRAGLAGLRRTLPARIGRMLAHARADAAMLHYALVSRRLVERCHARGAAVLAWTLEDEEALRRVLAAGVDGVIANDPRLFAN
jgi:glycerophosphoryl diester phosphodiesterase